LHLKIKVYGLLGDLLKKEIPSEAELFKTGPVTLREALAEIGISDGDLQWIAVWINGELVKRDILDSCIYLEQAEISVYPVFAGG